MARLARIRRILMRSGALLGLLACAEATVVAPAMADVGSSMQTYFNDAGSAANVTGPTAFNGQNAGYYSAGNVWMRFPQKNIQPFNLQLPHARAGCGGIDLFAGSFSFINSAEMVAMLKAVANNAIGFAFKLAIDSISPQISKVMDELAQKAEKLNQMNISSCETAQGLLKGIWPINDANRSVICESVGNSQGIFSDWAATRQGCNNGGRRDSTIAGNTDPNMTNQMVGEDHNFTWDVLNKEAQFVGFDTDMKEYIMTLVGTVITRKTTDATKNGPSVEFTGPASDVLTQALLDGTVGAAPVAYWSCDDPAIGKCLNLKSKNLVITPAQAIRPRVTQLLINISDAIRTNSAIGANEKALINVASIPVYKILAVQAATRGVLSKEQLDTIAEITAVDILQAMMQDLLDKVAQSKTSLVRADQQSAEMWRQGIDSARQRISNRGISISNRVQVTMEVINHSIMLESTLQNSMSPGMTAALNFGRGLNAQGIMQ